jgi:uncharacterized protein
LKKTLENRLKDTVISLLEKGRDGDWDHVRRAVDYGRYLLHREAGDPEIVIPALYLHDIGWSQIDFRDFTHASPARAEHTESEHLHMKLGALLAEKILRELDYDPEKSRVIVSVIAVHDIPEKVFAMKNLSAALIVEADRLDRYGKESIERFEAMFGSDYMEGEKGKEWTAYLKNGLENWFVTETGKSLARDLAKKSGLA